MEYHPRSRRRSLQDRLVIYRLILATSLFWICVDLCILAYLMNDNSLRVEIKSADFAIPPRAYLGNRDDDRFEYRASVGSARIDNSGGDDNVEVIDVRVGKQANTPELTSTDRIIPEEPITSNEEDENGSKEVKEEEKDANFFKDILVDDYSDLVTNPPFWPGERGQSVRIPAELKELEKQRFNENQFNILASDMIALNRGLPDWRHEK